MYFQHRSVLLDGCVENLNIKKDGIYIDGTLGAAGHSKSIAEKLGSDGLLIGIDQDINAIKAASKNLQGSLCQLELVHDNFRNLEEILNSLEIDAIDGLLLDLGVSSHQLDEAGRGFSYMHDAELDMRMDTRNLLTAKQVVNDYPKQELERIFWQYGEEKWGKRVAEFIVEYRRTQEIRTTYELVDIIKKAIPKAVRRVGGHPAKKIFQAIRIEVNQELEIIENTIRIATNYMNPGGRICVITFHSLEDRIVKNTFRNLNNPCTCPPQFPVCKCNNKKMLNIITRKPILPTTEEIQENNRSRSAKLRVAEKV